MDDLIDKETKQFLLVLAGIMIYIFFIYPRMSGSNLGNDLVNGPLRTSKPAVAQMRSVNFDKNKDYTANVSTTEGDFVIDLFEKSAPKNVESVMRQADAYKDGSFVVQSNFLLKADAKSDLSSTVPDEINADSLGLQNQKVGDVKYFKNLYNPSDPTTKYFSPENLSKYDDFTVKEFYEEILDYKYSTDIQTPEAKKYMVYMTSTGPGTNKTDFFILMTDSAANVNGRYTPIGQVISGFDTLDKINESKSRDVSINSVTIQS